MWVVMNNCDINVIVKIGLTCYGNCHVSNITSYEFPRFYQSYSCSLAPCSFDRKMVGWTRIHCLLMIDHLHPCVFFMVLVIVVVLLLRGLVGMSPASAQHMVKILSSPSYLLYWWLQLKWHDLCWGGLLSLFQYWLSHWKFKAPLGMIQLSELS
jgi:hypothetical protein